MGVLRFVAVAEWVVNRDECEACADGLAANGRRKLYGFSWHGGSLTIFEAHAVATTAWEDP